MAEMLLEPLELLPLRNEFHNLKQQLFIFLIIFAHIKELLSRIRLNDILLLIVIRCA